VARGGLLHDIGKNRVPRVVLDKPSALDSSEWQSCGAMSSPATT